MVDSMDLDVVNLQNNTLSKGCIPLEQLFDRHDVYKGKNTKQQTDKALRIQHWHQDGSKDGKDRGGYHRKREKRYT